MATQNSCVVQVVGYRFLIAENWRGAQGRPCQICGGQRGTGTGLYLISFVLRCQYHFTAVSYSVIYHWGMERGPLVAQLLRSLSLLQEEK